MIPGRPRRRIVLVPALVAAGTALAAGLGAALFWNDPADRCADAGGRWDPRRRACEMAPPPKGPVNVAVAGAIGAARVLDLNSFPNAIGRRPDARTFADYGFTLVVRTRDGVELYREDQAAMFGLRVLDDGPQAKRLCLVERALKGGTRRSVRAIEVRPGEDGLWRASPAPVVDERCPRSEVP